MYIQISDSVKGDVYSFNGNIWSLVGNIRGPQGIQGPQGVQGIQGIQGPEGPQGPTGDVGGFVNIWGILATDSLLPLPSSLDNLTVAYLVGASEPYDLYIQIGTSSDTAYWENTGPFNAGTLIEYNGTYVNVFNADTFTNLENGTGIGSTKTKGVTDPDDALTDNSNAATGKYSTALGAQNTVSGFGSLAAGRGINNIGTYSAAFGKNTEITNSLSYGNFVHGIKCRAGKGATTQGGITTDEETNGSSSHAEGIGSAASGAGSHAEGRECYASANYSHAEGLRTQATTLAQLVCGKNNITNNDALFIVGCGPSSNNKQNCFQAGMDNTGKFIYVGSTKIYESQMKLYTHYVTIEDDSYNIQPFSFSFISHSNTSITSILDIPEGIYAVGYETDLGNVISLEVIVASNVKHIYCKYLDNGMIGTQEINTVDINTMSDIVKDNLF